MWTMWTVLPELIGWRTRFASNAKARWTERSNDTQSEANPSGYTPSATII